MPEIFITVGVLFVIVGVANIIRGLYMLWKITRN